VNRTDISSIGRAVDLTYATNRAIAVITLLVAIGGLLWQRLSGAPWLASTTWGSQAGLTVFLTWALCRELDPDHPTAAFAAAGFALVAVLVWALPQLALILWLVILMRVVNRSTGLAAGVLDAVGLVGLAGWLSLQDNWAYGLITAIALFLDSQLPDPTRRQLPFALLSAIVTALVAILASASLWETPSVMVGLGALGLSLVFLPVILAARSIESIGDETEERLRPARVQAAQVLALLTGVGAAFLDGSSALVRLGPLWASVLGASFTWLKSTLPFFGSSS